MALLSLEGTLKKENRFNDGALRRISQALHGLASSLQEFREVETMLGLESAAEADHGGADDALPNFLGVVAGTLKEMVGRLVSDIEATPEIQKLLLVIQKSGSGAANEGATIAKQGSFSAVGTVASSEAEAVCTSGTHSRTVRRAAVGRAVGCRHFCALHQEVMDPNLWSTLPVELIQLALANLPIAKILDIYAHSTWSTIARSSNFRQVCFESHPKLFGLVVQEIPGETLRNVVYDIKSNEWINRDLVGFHQAFGITDNDWLAYMSHSKYACDGGLVCFVPETRMLTSSSIRIGNPLTDEWKALPCLPHLPFENCQAFMVQLVTEVDTKCYKVILVFGDERRIKYAAQCYNSKRRGWSCMESGLVYGDRGSLMRNQVNDPCVFDCTTKTMYRLVYRPFTGRNTSLKVIKTTNALYRFDDPSIDPYLYLEGLYARRCTMVKDRLFVLHECSSNLRDPKGFQISEYAWQSNTSELRIINSSAPEPLPINHNLVLFASGRSIFLSVDNGGTREQQHQLIRLYNSFANDWHILPDMGDVIRDQILDTRLRPAFWCELRWDAVP